MQVEVLVLQRVGELVHQHGAYVGCRLAAPHHKFLALGVVEPNHRRREQVVHRRGEAHIVGEQVHGPQEPLGPFACVGVALGRAPEASDECVASEQLDLDRRLEGQPPLGLDEPLQRGDHRADGRGLARAGRRLARRPPRA